MGERVAVTLVTPAEYIEEVTHIALGYGENPQDVHTKNGLTEYHFYDVNYGDLDFLSELRQAGIAYNSTWEASAGFNKGTDHLRFTEAGEAVRHRHYIDEGNPPLKELLDLINLPEQLVEYIKNFAETNTVLPWDNQAEYGKRYLAMQLISPT